MATKHIHNALNFIVFLFLDFLEANLCIVYKCLDKFLEGKSYICYCGKKGTSKLITGRDTSDNELSESLYDRRNIFSEMGFLLFPITWEDGSCRIRHAVGDSRIHRWSDCSCESCLSWIKYGGDKLHVVIREPSAAIDKPIENVIFLHGMLSSSLFWTETVFPNLSETTKNSYKLFAIDLLGFGGSPKPMDCLYTLQDHLEMIEKSVINPYKLKSFHLVAHSMGCIIALAMVAKYSNSIISMTLVSPACFYCSKDESSLEVLKTIATKTLWPPKAFYLSVMSWYEHLGRSFCFLLCRQHVTLGRIIKLLNKGRDSSLAVKDLVKHTHHSIWHTIQNVICGSAKFMDGYLEILKNSRAKISLIHGDRDNSAPIECSYNIKRKIPRAMIPIIL